MADNASVDGSEAAVVVADPAVIYHQTGANLGYGGGCNRGVARTSARNPYLLCLNPDARCEPGALADTGRRARPPCPTSASSDPGSRRATVALPVGAHVPRPGRRRGPRLPGFVWPDNPFTRRYSMLDWDHAAAADVDWVSGACFAHAPPRRGTESAGSTRPTSCTSRTSICAGGPSCGLDRGLRAGGGGRPRPGRLDRPASLPDDRRAPPLAAPVRGSKTTTGAKRLLLPVIAAGLVIRGPAGLAPRVLAGRRHAPEAIKRPEQAPVGSARHGTCIFEQESGPRRQHRRRPDRSR